MDMLSYDIKTDESIINLPKRYFKKMIEEQRAKDKLNENKIKLLEQKFNENKISEQKVNENKTPEKNDIFKKRDKKNIICENATYTDCHIYRECQYKDGHVEKNVEETRKPKKELNENDFEKMYGTDKLLTKLENERKQAEGKKMLDNVR
jgi:hypothetical protein